jgi:hypothetical protein
VTAEATIDSQGNVCTADCGLVEVMCTLDLPDGTYTLKNGSEEVVIVLPATAEVCGGTSER